MDNRVDVVIGTVIYRQGSYIIDKFLANQKEIQQEYPSSELLLATNEPDYVEELGRFIKLGGVKGRVIPYETVKPSYARSKVWNIASGREMIRQYMLSQTGAKYLLSLDVDMIYAPDIISIMEREIKGCDVLFSGAPLRELRNAIGMGIGCAMLTRDVLEKVAFRCIEFRDGDVIDDGCTLELDLIRLGRRIRKGIFLSIAHYMNENEVRHINPQPLGLFRSITTSRFIRCVLLRGSVLLRRDIATRLRLIVYRFIGLTR